MSFRNWTRRVAALLLATVLLTGLSATAESVVAIHRARVYEYPAAGARSAAIPAGTVMEMTGQKDGWIRVERRGIVAYMAASDVVGFTDCGSATAYLKQDTPMYKSYGKSAQYGTIPAGAAVKVYALAGDWAMAAYRGKRGFVAKAALTTEAPAAGTGGDPGVTLTKGLYAYASHDGAPVYKLWTTSSKVLGVLGANAKLAVGALKGDWALVGLKGHYGFMRKGDLSLEPVAAPQAPAQPAKPVIQAMDWWKSDIQSIFARGVTATITDVATGISWREIRKGGTNHADCQPLTASDTANMKKACGGKWSWDRRAVIVTINGQHYAASMNCMPHGGGSVSGNNYDGHHCYHFINSSTSTSSTPDKDHQAAIQKALALNAKL